MNDCGWRDLLDYHSVDAYMTIDRGSPANGTTGGDTVEELTDSWAPNSLHNPNVPAGGWIPQMLETLEEWSNASSTAPTQWLFTEIGYMSSPARRTTATPTFRSSMIPTTKP